MGVIAVCNVCVCPVKLPQYESLPILLVPGPVPNLLENVSEHQPRCARVNAAQ